VGRSYAQLVGGLFVLFFARIILKDLRDRLGDARFGKPTLLLRIGKRATCAVSMAGAAQGTAVLIAGLSSLPRSPCCSGPAGRGSSGCSRGSRAPTTNEQSTSRSASPRAPGTDSSLLILAVLILRAQGADERAIVIVVGCLVAVFAASFLDAAIHPERVRIGYKA
jgi:hypothetical protein